MTRNTKVELDWRIEQIYKAIFRLNDKLGDGEKVNPEKINEIFKKANPHDITNLIVKMAEKLENLNKSKNGNSHNEAVAFINHALDTSLSQYPYSKFLHKKTCAEKLIEIRAKIQGRPAKPVFSI